RGSGPNLASSRCLVFRRRYQVRFWGVDHAEGMHVHGQDGLLLLPVGGALLAAGHDLWQRLDVDAGGLGLQVLVADVAVERSPLPASTRLFWSTNGRGCLGAEPCTLVVPLPPRDLPRPPRKEWPTGHPAARGSPSLAPGEGAALAGRHPACKALRLAIQRF